MSHAWAGLNIEWLLVMPRHNSIVLIIDSFSVLLFLLQDGCLAEIDVIPPGTVNLMLLINLVLDPSICLVYITEHQRRRMEGGSCVNCFILTGYFRLEP